MTSEQKKRNGNVTKRVEAPGPVEPVEIARAPPGSAGDSPANVATSPVDSGGHSVPVSPAVRVLLAAGDDETPGSVNTVPTLLPTGVNVKQVNLLKKQVETFESFSKHIDVFMVEVYRCKLCRFHSASKAIMSQHMTGKHFPSPGISISKGATASKPRSGSDHQPFETIVITRIGNEQESLSTAVGTVASSNENQFMPLPSRMFTPSPTSTTTTTSTSTCTTPTVAAHVQVPSPMSTTCSTQVSGENAPEQLNTSQANTASIEGNALELLMGIGHENNPDVSRSKQTMTNQSGTGTGPTPDEVTSSKSSESKRETGLTATMGMSGSEAVGLVTVDEEELAKTLRDDDQKDSDSERESLVGGDDDEDDDDDEDEDGDDARAEDEDLSDDNIKQSNQKDLGGKEMLFKPIQVQIGLGSSAPDIDIQEIANTASKSNPKATTITVLHHGPGNGPPTAIQFKKSRKSKAVIPTGESLGIASPFTASRAYKGNKLFPCNTCDARYKSRVELERHIENKHRRVRKFLCEICGIALATRASVKYHVSKKHDEIRMIFNCNACDYCTPFAARMAIHRATHQSEFFCDLCKKSYVSAERLTRHYSSPLHKNSLNPLVCEHCGYSTKKRDNFLVHMRKHTGEKPYKCKLCNYASADGSTLKKHVMAKHSTIRPFKCPVCSFSCVDKKGLDVHSRKHTGERPFKCQHCQYAAKRRCALNVHLQTHSKEDSADKQPKPTRYENTRTLAQASQQPLQQTARQIPRQTRQQTLQHTQPHTPQKTRQQTPQQEQQYTTMADYQPTTLAAPVVQSIPQTVVGQSLVSGCEAKPVETVWHNV